MTLRKEMSVFNSVRRGVVIKGIRRKRNKKKKRRKGNGEVKMGGWKTCTIGGNPSESTGRVYRGIRVGVLRGQRGNVGSQRRDSEGNES